MSLQPQRQECLTQEDEEYCFHRLGELLFAESDEPESKEECLGLRPGLAVASRHGWTVYTCGKSEHQLQAQGDSPLRMHQLHLISFCSHVRH